MNPERASLMKLLKSTSINRSLPLRSAYLGLSMTRLIGFRLRVLLEWVAKSTIYRRRMKQHLKATKRRGDSCTSFAALVLGNGPSLDGLNVDSVNAFRQRGGQIFAVNFFNETRFAPTLIPDYYVLADPVWFSPDLNESRPSATWDYINAHPNITLCLPATLSHVPLQGHECLYFNDISLEGWTENASPLRPHGFSNITVYHALSIALFLGFNPVYTLGIDNDAFLSLAINDGGRVVLRGNHHAYGGETGAEIIPLQESVAAVLADYAQIFDDLRLFDAGRIRNLASPSLIQIFPHAKLEDWSSAPRSID